MRADQPILIFDSGVGGLSIMHPIRAALPNAPIVYAMDREGYPYGVKSPEELAIRVPALLGRLAEHCDPRIIVIACNTASVIALDPVREALHLPVVGTVPAIKPAAELSKSRTIGVLGTPATVRQPYVENLSRDFAADCTVIRYGSSELVDLAERKIRGKPGTPDDFARVMDGLFGQPGGESIDTIVLACTHFPLVADELAAAAPRPVRFVDGGPGIARRVANLTRGQPWPSHPRLPTGLVVGDSSGERRLLEGMRRTGIERFADI